MAHAILKSGYSRMVERLNRFPQGAPPSQLLLEILKMLMSEREADLISRLPIRPFTAKTASRAWGLPEAQSRRILDALAGRVLLVDIETDGDTAYVLPPPMAGFFEFSMMRVRDDLNQKVLSELFYAYLNVEEDFVRELFTQGETRLGRAFVHEPALVRPSGADGALHVLDWERATHIIRTAAPMGVSMCYCRHKMHHLSRACAAPLDICMTFNTTAASLIRHGYARRVDAAEGLDLLQTAYARNLVQFGENVRERVNFICNCCGCCCEALIAYKRLGYNMNMETNWFCELSSPDKCVSCGLCKIKCPVDAITMADGKPVIDIERCIGCGVCTRFCRVNAITLQRRPEEVYVPKDTLERFVMEAISTGKLQNLILDNYHLKRYDVLRRILGVLLKLPPAKWALANKQLVSKGIEFIRKHVEG